MAVIFIGSEQPAVRRAPEKVEFLVAKVAHVLEFAALGAALSRAIAPSRGPIPSRAVGFAVAIAALYAASDEYHQTFTPGRTATVRDVGIDVIGALAGGAGYTQIRRNRSRQPAAGLY
jgi:VanZ family protein